VLLEDGVVTGFLYCALLLLRSGAGQELLLYEVGVRKASRRKGVGRALLGHMESWMQQNDVREVWVCADNGGAVDFYRGCGFSTEGEQPVYMTREVGPGPKKPTTTLLSFK
jgi:ribosomal protein S18 acetylase RimI-like enzyme